MLQGNNDLLLVKNSPRAAELPKVVREQSGKFFRGATELWFRHEFFELTQVLSERWFSTHDVVRDTKPGRAAGQRPEDKPDPSFPNCPKLES